MQKDNKELAKDTLKPVLNYRVKSIGNNKYTIEESIDYSEYYIFRTKYRYYPHEASKDEKCLTVAEKNGPILFNTQESALDGICVIKAFNNKRQCFTLELLNDQLLLFKE